MGIYTRPDSKYWQLWLENAPKGQEKERTRIVIGTTAAARKDSERTALDLYHRRMDELARNVHRLPNRILKGVRFAELATIYDRDTIAQHKGKEREREILARLIRDFGDLPITEISKDVARAWRSRRLKTPTVIEHFGGPNGPRHTFPPPSARSVNREIDLLQQILASGVPTYYERSPLEDLEDVPIVKPIRRTMTHAEEHKILRQLARDDRAILLIGLDTLARFGDILDLQRMHYRRDETGIWVLDIVDPKNGEPHTVPVSPRVRQALEQLPKDDPYFFWRRRQAKTDRDRRNVFAHALKRACEAADVPYGRAARGITFHWATRRTGATRMIRRGRDGVIGTVQKIGNWKHPDVLIGIYQETTTAEMRAAVAGVSRPIPKRA